MKTAASPAPLFFVVPVHEAVAVYAVVDPAPVAIDLVAVAISLAAAVIPPADVLFLLLEILTPPPSFDLHLPE